MSWAGSHRRRTREICEGKVQIASLEAMLCFLFGDLGREGGERMQDSSYVTAVVLSRRQPCCLDRGSEQILMEFLDRQISRQGAEKSLGFLLTCRVSFGRPETGPATPPSNELLGHADGARRRPQGFVGDLCPVSNSSKHLAIRMGLARFHFHSPQLSVP